MNAVRVIGAATWLRESGGVSWLICDLWLGVQLTGTEHGAPGFDFRTEKEKKSDHFTKKEKPSELATIGKTPISRS